MRRRPRKSDKTRPKRLTRPRRHRNASAALPLRRGFPLPAPGRDTRARFAGNDERGVGAKNECPTDRRVQKQHEAFQVNTRANTLPTEPSFCPRQALEHFSHVISVLFLPAPRYASSNYRDIIPQRFPLRKGIPRGGAFPRRRSQRTNGLRRCLRVCMPARPLASLAEHDGLCGPLCERSSGHSPN